MIEKQYHTRKGLKIKTVQFVQFVRSVRGLQNWTPVFNHSVHFYKPDNSPKNTVQICPDISQKIAD